MDLRTKIKMHSAPKFYTDSMVMRFCLGFSLVFHIFALLAVQNVLPINWIFNPPKTYQVELIRLPVDPLDTDEMEDGDLTRVESQKKTPEKPQEEQEHTISLDTKDKRYAPYAKRIKAKLMKEWEYPRQAWENLLEGRVGVLFSLNPQGRLIDIQITSPSGHKLLDGEALRAIRTAPPFPPFPSSLKIMKLNINANFDYRLTAKRPE